MERRERILEAHMGDKSMIIIGTLDLRHVDGEDWKLLMPLSVQWKNRAFDVRQGFETDLASIPRVVRGLVPRGRNETRAAVVHDWLYRGHENGWKREEADELFLEAMAEDGVGWLRRRVIHRAVRMFGLWSWKG